MASPIRSLCTAGAALTMLLLVSPAAWASQATALKCKDGTISATSGRGACSGHGGIDKTATKTERKTVKLQEKAAKTVVKKAPGTQVTQLCADGSTSNSTGRGACSGHGGVKAAAATSKATGVPITAESRLRTGAIAQCKDGLYSHAKTRTGVCASHGGVAKWL